MTKLIKISDPTTNGVAGGGFVWSKLSGGVWYYLDVDEAIFEVSDATAAVIIADGMAELYYPKYYYYGSGVIKGRIGIRTGKTVIDQTLTTTGFDGTINVDWENLTTQS